MRNMIKTTDPIKAGRELAAYWVAFMRETGRVSCMFFIDCPANDAGGTCLGVASEELGRHGYVVQSHSATPVGEIELPPDAPPNVEPIRVDHFSFLVQQVRGPAPKAANQPQGSALA